ncbi:MAG: VanZ family protein [SAR202 cluster bacterium]|nr:VanZ family protein [SAR202 cluster bacterium]
MPVRNNTHTTLAIYWLPAVVWAVVISAVSHIPAPELEKAADAVGPVPIALDIAYHVSVFGVMGALAHWVASRHLGSHAKWSYFAPLAFAIGYGVIDEFHQSFVAGRSAAAEDVGYDSIGAVIGIAAIIAVRFALSRTKRGPTTGRS